METAGKERTTGMSEPPLFVALYTDSHITRILAKELKARGFDALSAHDVGNSDLDDADHLAYAAEHQRALLTFNAKDFVPLFSEWWAQGRIHAGVIVSEQIPLSELLRRTLNLLNTMTAREMENNLVNLGAFAGRE